MKEYKDFAYLYDKLTDDVNYQARVDYIEKQNLCILPY